MRVECAKRVGLLHVGVEPHRGGGIAMPQHAAHHIDLPGVALQIQEAAEMAEQVDVELEPELALQHRADLRGQDLAYLGAASGRGNRNRGLPPRCSGLISALRYLARRGRSAPSWTW